MKLSKCFISNSELCSSKALRLVCFEQQPPSGDSEIAPDLKKTTLGDLHRLQSTYEDGSLTTEERLAAYKKITDFYEAAKNSKDPASLATWERFKKDENKRFWQKERTVFRAGLKEAEVKKLDAGVAVGKEYNLAEDANIFDRNGKPRGVLFAGKNIVIPVSNRLITIDGDEYVRIRIKDKANPYASVKSGLMLKSALSLLEPAPVVEKPEVEPAVEQKVEVEPRQPIHTPEKKEVPVTGLPGEKERAEIDAKKAREAQAAKEAVKPMDVLKSLEDQYGQHRGDVIRSLEGANASNEACVKFTGEAAALLKSGRLSAEAIGKITEARQQLLQFDKFYGKADSSYKKLVTVIVDMRRNGYDRAKVEALQSQAGDLVESMARSEADMTEATQVLNRLETEVKHLKEQARDHSNLDNLKRDVQSYIANHAKEGVTLEAHADGVFGRIVVGRYPFEESQQRLSVTYVSDKGGQYVVRKGDNSVLYSTETMNAGDKALSQQDKLHTALNSAIEYLSLQNE